MTAHQLEAAAMECRDARAQADTARDLATRLRTERVYLQRRYVPAAPQTLRTLDDAIIFLSALGGQP